MRHTEFQIQQIPIITENFIANPTMKRHPGCALADEYWLMALLLHNSRSSTVPLRMFHGSNPDGSLQTFLQKGGGFGYPTFLNSEGMILTDNYYYPSISIYLRHNPRRQYGIKLVAPVRYLDTTKTLDLTQEFSKTAVLNQDLLPQNILAVIMASLASYLQKRATFPTRERGETELARFIRVAKKLYGYSTVKWYYILKDFHNIPTGKDVLLPLSHHIDPLVLTYIDILEIVKNSEPYRS